MGKVTTSQEFASWLREMRSRTGMSQPELAETIQVEERTIRRYERGHGVQSFVQFLRLLDALGVKLKPEVPINAPRALNAEIQALRSELTREIRLLRKAGNAEAVERDRRKYQSEIEKLRGELERARQAGKSPTRIRKTA